MWGQGACDGTLVLALGIIPTRVGTSLLQRLTWIKLRDHPHACGDKSESGAIATRIEGSSPRVWGQADFKNLATSGLRIIPTRVGTSLVENISDTIDEDHPHACGDKTKEIKENSGFAKSTA